MIKGTIFKISQGIELWKDIDDVYFLSFIDKQMKSHFCALTKNEVKAMSKGLSKHLSQKKKPKNKLTKWLKGLV